MKLSQDVEEKISDVFRQIDEVSFFNTRKVLSAFHSQRVSEADFAGTTGYGYGDRGRDKLDAIYAEVFRCEDALVRLGFVNGTHAISKTLFGVLRPGDTLLSATGAPYDTLRGAVGISGSYHGSLREFGVEYAEVELRDGLPDYEAISKAAGYACVKAVLIQRSGGYSGRKAFSVETIGRIVASVRKTNAGAVIIVDNCYGEFVESGEPTQVGADLAVGSLIKNPGGGLAPTGGYVAGRRELVEMAAMSMTSPGIGRECGSTLGNNRLMYQGLFMAPHTVAQALKTAVFCAGIMRELGYSAFPDPGEPRSDIIQLIEFGNPDALKAFCRGIQSGAPVDSFVTPEAWDMPGYDCQVIMAAGAFIQGASIELSCDGPMKPPYTAYMQGGLTYESGKAGILLAVENLLKTK